MKLQYDFLISDKISFIFLNKAKIVLDDGMLVAYNGEFGKEIIPVASVAILFLGYGCSITQEALLFCSKHDCYICASRGGLNIHAIYYEGRYKNPQNLINQVLLHQNEEKRFSFAKELLKLRLMICENTSNFNFEVDKMESIEVLLGKEGNYSKKTYAKFANQYKIDDFKRENCFNEKYKKENLTKKDLVNKRLNLLNNVLYSFCTVLCYVYSLEPSLAFIHGKTRRGGLCFDLADLIKNKIVLPLAFDLKIEEKDLMVKLRTSLMEKDNKYTKMLLKLCKEISEGNVINAEKFFEECKI